MHSGFFALPHAPASTRETLAVQCGFGTGLDGPALVVLSDIYMHEVPPATAYAAPARRGRRPRLELRAEQPWWRPGLLTGRAASVALAASVCSRVGLRCAAAAAARRYASRCSSAAAAAASRCVSRCSSDLMRQDLA
jgi:hypothetical protein